jgi:hypothetical protein
VPPPPVGGATVGTGLGEGLCVTVGDAEGLGEVVGEGLGEVVGEGLTEELALGVAVPLGEADAVAEGLLEGDDLGSSAEGEDPVQAETAAETSIVTMPKLTAVRVALRALPAVLARSFMGPPRVCRRGAAPFPGPHQKTASEGGMPIAGHRYAMACSPPEYQATRAGHPGEDGGE